MSAAKHQDPNTSAVWNTTSTSTSHHQKLLQNIMSQSGRRLFGPQTLISHPTLCVSAANWVFRRESFSSKQQLVTCQSSCWRRRTARAPKVQLSQNRNAVRHDSTHTHTHTHTHTFCSLVSCLFTLRSTRPVFKMKEVRVRTEEWMNESEDLENVWSS